MSHASASDTNRWIWAFAAVFALCGHAALGAYAIWPAQSLEFDDQPAGSIVLELSPFLTSAAAAAPAPAIGPESIDSLASAPQRAAQPRERVETEVPLAQPSPTLAEPDLAVRERVAEKTPVEKQEPDLPPEAQKESAAELSVASQAMAPPKVDAPVLEKSAAPAIGVTARALRAKLTWHQAIAVHLNRFKRFPADAGAAHAKGEVLVQFALDRAGTVLTSMVVRASGSAALDAEALAMLQRAMPFPRPDADVPGDTFTLAVPVVFRQR